MIKRSFRLTIRAMMIAILIAAIVSAIGVTIPRPLNMFLRDRALRVTGWRYLAYLATLTLALSLPFAVAVVLAIGAAGKNRSPRGIIVRSLLAACALALGLTLAHYPLDGIRRSGRLKDGTVVSYFTQYRIWPAEEVTPCLETITTTGGAAQTYPIARNTRFRAFPEFRTNADETVVWLIDDPKSPYKLGNVWCSLNRATGEFVGIGGKHPECVGATGGFPFPQIR
jgi:hypothetical protein